MGHGSATFIMLNPSTADAVQDDPTIRRCIGFARRWNCGSLTVLNLFALRATKPAALKRAIDPFGPDNKAWFEKILRKSSGTLLICGWGVHGSFRSQDLTVLRWLNDLGVKPLTLGLTKEVHPRHPLYAPSSAEPVSFMGRRASGIPHAPISIPPALQRTLVRYEKSMTYRPPRNRRTK